MQSLVHGDDFGTAGKVEDLFWLRNELEKRFEIKSTTIGEDETLEKEVHILNRKVTWHKNVGLSYEADPKHALTIINETGASEMKSLSVPIVKDPAETDSVKSQDVEAKKREGRLGQKYKPAADDLLNATDTTAYRGLAATLNYLAADRGDLIYAAKECAREMSSPTKRSWEKMVRVGRYLKGKPRLRIWYKYQDEPSVVTTHSDTDWAGCKRTRRSTTGGYASYGTHLLKMWCRTQATIALSSAEAELYGMVRASAETIGLMSMFKDLGVEVGGQILGDASAALAIIERRGIGKIRHLDTNYLWVQEQAATGRLRYQKVSGKENGSDLFTKALSWEEVAGHVHRLEGEFLDAESPKGLEVFGGGKLQENVLREAEALAKDLKMVAPVAWHRGDMQAKTLKTSMRGGPAWSDVVGRLTVDATSGGLIKSEQARHITRNTEHSLLPGYPRDILTVLLYEKSVERSTQSC